MVLLWGIHCRTFLGNEQGVSTPPCGHYILFTEQEAGLSASYSHINKSKGKFLADISFHVFPFATQLEWLFPFYCT